jgi:hypothetical protein
MGQVSGQIDPSGESIGTANRAVGIVIAAVYRIHVRVARRRRKLEQKVVGIRGNGKLNPRVSIRVDASHLLHKWLKDAIVARAQIRLERSLLRSDDNSLARICWALKGKDACEGVVVHIWLDYYTSAVFGDFKAIRSHCQR